MVDRVLTATGGKGGRLDRDEGAEILGGAGVEVVASRSVGSFEAAAAAAAELGYPVVLKAGGRDRRAKTVAGGFALDLADERALRAAWDRMGEHLGDNLVPALVQTMLEPGVDVAVELVTHPVVGPYIAIGAGGAGALFDTRDDIQLLPLGDIEAKQLVDRSRLATVLPVADRRALADVILALAGLAEEVPEIVAARLNPVIVGQERAIVTDIEIDVAPVEVDPLPPLRRA